MKTLYLDMDDNVVVDAPGSPPDNFSRGKLARVAPTRVPFLPTFRQER